VINAASEPNCNLSRRWAQPLKNNMLERKIILQTQNENGGKNVRRTKQWFSLPNNKAMEELTGNSTSCSWGQERSGPCHGNCKIKW
jgi:hypothetical protein